MHKFFILFFFCSYFGFAQKEYSKIYYPNGNLKEEGWQQENEKIDYWYFYDSEGNKIQEGHFENNKKSNWWIFYDTNHNTAKKCEFVNGKKNGICLIYTNGKLSRAEKYNNGKLINSWTELSEFKKDNNI
jgi:antitoxin component YwqK of YwqJK toxin-antitoxin module